MSFFYTSVDRDFNNILFRGYKDGKQIKHKIQYKPKLYIESKEPTKFKTLKGKYLGDVEFQSMADAHQFVKQYKDVGNFPIYGNQNFVHQFISDIFNTTELKLDRSAINVATFDIEVATGDDGFPFPEEAKHPIITIAYHSSVEDVYVCWGLYDYDPKKSINKDIRIKYVKCADEQELLLKFLDHWKLNYPDVITGWNSRMFDIVYLINRVTKIFSEGVAKQFSPWNLIRSETIEIAGKPHQFYTISGIQQLDYIDLFKKFGYAYGTQESYKLDNIANVVLGEKKLDYSEYGTLAQLYKNDFQKFCDYNIKDTHLVCRLEEKLNLISLCITIAYKARVNFAEAFGSVAIWDALIYNELRKENVVVPPKKDNEKLRQIEGAYVKDPIVGLHNWVVSFDLNSLYPHIMMQYNMSPETVIDREQRYKQLLEEAKKRGLQYAPTF